MKDLINSASKLFLKRIVLTVMAFFVVVSIMVVSTVIFSDVVGYTVYGVKEGSETREFLYNHYNKDGEDTKQAEFEEQGYSLTMVDMREMGQQGTKYFLILNQVICLLILVFMIYPQMWDLGFKDRNMVMLGHKKEDKLKGLKIGLISSVPAVILILAIAVCGLGLYKGLDLSLYKFINGAFYSLSQVIIGESKIAGDLSVWQYLLLLALQLIIPFVSAIGYILGTKEFSIKEKLVYKKEK